MKIVTVSQMQKAERECSMFGTSLDMLMENAGKAFAEATRALLGNIRQQNIVVLVGPGNNGGDGLVAARHLHDWGARVLVYLCAQRPENDPNLEQVRRRGIPGVEVSADINLDQLKVWLSSAQAVVDAVFGTGKSRALSGFFAQVLNLVSEAKRQRHILHLIALDLPSGLNADTGAVDPATPRVDNTITLGYPKVGLFNLPGAEKAGKITVVDIGIPAQLVDYIDTELLTGGDIKTALPERLPVSHKGTYGKVMALVGSLNYPGAAYLACSGAIRVGAGLTTLAIARSLQPVLAAKLTEVTYLPLPEVAPGIASVDSALPLIQQIPQYDVLLIGCGLGQHKPIADLVEVLLLNSRIKLPRVVVDADGLNTLARIPEWWRSFSDEAVFTPHAGEMARLLGKSGDDIQNNRIETARAAASRWHKTVVLKGAYTVIASPNGLVRVSPFANAGLASAGTGDILAGSIAGLLSQGLPLFEAAFCGVYLNGLAGEIVKTELGDAGMLASDLLPVLPRAIRQLKEV
jgi:ADP-dependent NAD(P)H-hydrate dehydratase / NAD(P)H-hydrate epimerase